MSEIRPPEAGLPPVSLPSAPVPEEPEAGPPDAPWQAAVIRVSVVIAVWLGY